MHIEPMSEKTVKNLLAKAPYPEHVDAVYHYWEERLKKEGFAAYTISPDYEEGIVVIKAYHEPGRFDKSLDMCIQVEEFYKDNKELFPENELDRFMEDLER